MNSTIIMNYLINKLSMPICDDTLEIDRRIVELVKMKSRKPLKKTVDALNRQREYDKAMKDVEHIILKLNK